MALAVLLPAAPANAAEIECGQVYTVARGDTLFKIASRAYGDGWHYKEIYAANREVLRNEAAVEIGDRVFLPCLDGSDRGSHAPGTDSGAAALSASETPASGQSGPVAADHTAAPVLRALTHDRQSLPTNDGAAGAGPGNGGLLTELIARAIAPARIAPRFDAVPARHLDRLAAGRFDLAYPRLKPACGDNAALSAVEARECAEFVHSAPILEATLGFYGGKNGNADEFRSHVGLEGRRICVVIGGLGAMLAKAAPELSRSEVIAAADVESCLEHLFKGSADLAALPRRDARIALERHVAGDAIIEHGALAIARTLHVIAPRNNPDAIASIARLDHGLARMKASGAWFSILISHSSERLAASD